VVDNDTVFCTPDGLEARLNTIDTNTVDLEGDGTAGNPLSAEVFLTPDANVPDPDAVGAGNLLKEGTPGIYVSCEDIQDCVGAAISQVTVNDCMEYDDATNTISVLICGAPNGVECADPGDPDCPAGGLLVTPSADAGNGLVFGTDGRLFFQSISILAGDCMLITGSGTAGDPFVLTPQVAPEPNGLECIPGQGLAVIPSSDANHGLVLGTDGRLWVDNCPFLVAPSQLLFGNAGPCFEIFGDGCNVPMSAILRISDDPCNGLECRGDGLYVESDPTPVPDPVRLPELNQTFANVFNGNSGGIQVLEGPVCITINNPSPCKNLITTLDLTGSTDVGRQGGNITAGYEVSDNPGGPWQRIHSNGHFNPTPANRQVQNAGFSGNLISLPPGGSRQVCVRSVVQFNAVNTGRVFRLRRNMSLSGRWAN
jgi:hypothetical protein